MKTIQMSKSKLFKLWYIHTMEYKKKKTKIMM